MGIAWDCAHAAPSEVTFPQTRLLLILERMSGPQRRAAAASARRIVGAAATLPGLGTAGPGPL